MVNLNKFRAKVIENGMNIRKLSKLIGISTSAFYRKLKSEGTTFTIREVNDICAELKLTPEEIMSIFFADNVA